MTQARLIKIIFEFVTRAHRGIPFPSLFMWLKAGKTKTYKTKIVF